MNNERRIKVKQWINQSSKSEPITEDFFINTFSSQGYVTDH
jgi:hypothetical protein